MERPRCALERFGRMRRWLTAGTRWALGRTRELDRSPWHQCAAYVSVDPSVILGSASHMDAKYRPLHPELCVEVGADSQIFGHLVVQRPGAYIKIGKRTQIGASSLIAACGIEIGDDVLIAWGSTLMDN